MCPNWLSLMQASKVRQGGVAEVSMSITDFGIQTLIAFAMLKQSSETKMTISAITA